MKSLLTLTSVTAAALLLAGCGGGSSDTTTATTTGYVIDSAVANLDYDCVADGTSGTTGTNGEFHCQTRSQIRFRIGEYVLGEISQLPADGYVFPQDIVGVARGDITNEAVTKMAQLLQACDADANVSNGIHVAQEVKTALQNGTFDPATVDTVLSEVESVTHFLPSEEEAQNHLMETWRNHNRNQNASAQGGFDIYAYPMYELNEAIEETVAYMGNEERLAHDLYLALYNYHLEQGAEIRQLNNIATRSETQHIDIVQSIVHKYDINGSAYTEGNVTAEAMPAGTYGIPAVQELYDTLLEEGKASVEAALKVGCKVEVTDVNDLTADIATAQEAGAEDIVAAYEVLRNGSYNHYWSFNQGLINLGIAEGCCAAGSEYCHPEYPQNENGHNNP